MPERRSRFTHEDRRLRRSYLEMLDDGPDYDRNALADPVVVIDDTVLSPPVFFDDFDFDDSVEGAELRGRVLRGGEAQ